uniref:(northern house mosquito) hypothetical protein n=1 Tax=Culex pipiens TaxID=7175 RepID=A0A8D8K2E0_CULPI
MPASATASCKRSSPASAPASLPANTTSKSLRLPPAPAVPTTARWWPGPSAVARRFRCASLARSCGRSSRRNPRPRPNLRLPIRKNLRRRSDTPHSSPLLYTRGCATCECMSVLCVRVFFCMCERPPPSL